MANINTELEQIRKAVYGREVRGSIANAIELINKEQVNTSTAQTNLDSKFNQLIINAGNSNAEVVASRVKADGTQFDTLSKRLDKGDEAHDTLNNEVISSRTDSKNVVHKNLKARLDEFDLELDAIELQQDWNLVYNKTKVANDKNLVIRKTDNDNIDVYINHYLSRYQKWNFTRSNGFDNAVASHANGNAWQIDQVRNVILGNTTQKDTTSPTLVKTGTWNSSSDKIYSDKTGDYIEEKVFGTEIILEYLELSSNGIAEISIDGVVTQQLDMYANNAGKNVRVTLATGLNNIEHTVRIKVTGNRNNLSSGNKVWYRYLITNSKVNFDDLRGVVETVEDLPSGQSLFRYGQSAIELALLTELNGSRVWGGTYHKNLRPAVTNNQKIYIDGVLKDFSNIQVNTFYAAKDIVIIQDLMLMNVNTDIAKVNLIHHFTSDGCHIKWNLEWIANPSVERSYNAMFETYSDRALLGNTQDIIVAEKNESEKGNSKTDNMIGWNVTDNYVVSIKGLNTEKMLSNYSKNMYVADRKTGLKLYYPKAFAYTPKIGEKWISEFQVSISKLTNSDSFFAS